MTIFEAYRRAFVSQLRPAMLALAVGPVIAAALFWAFIMWWKWALFLEMVDKLIKTLPFMESIVDRLVAYGFAVVPGILTIWVLAALFIPLTLICALGFVSVAGMPVMLRHVGGRDFAGLEQRRGGNVAGSVGNSILALFKFLVIALFTFPFWFIPFVGWLILPLLLGRLNARVLAYDALADHATPEELEALRFEPGLSWGWLGFAGALLNLVPFFWFFSTTVTGLAFIHYGLDALARRRATVAPKLAA